jgi:hypothetical protein
VAVVVTSFAHSGLNDWALLLTGLVLAPLWSGRLVWLLGRRIPIRPGG